MAEKRWRMNPVAGFIVIAMFVIAIILVEGVQYFGEKERNLAAEPIDVSVKIARKDTH